MQLRMVIHAIPTPGVHAQRMTEAEAMTLMTARAASRRDGEASGKWRARSSPRRSCRPTTSATTEVADLAQPDLRRRGPVGARPPTGQHARPRLLPRPPACSAKSVNRGGW